MINRERQMRDEEVATLYLDYETLGSAADVLKNLIKLYGRDARIRSYCEPYGNSDKEYLHVLVPRPETDKEMEERIKREEAYELRQSQFEKAQYEALKQKFGD